jgi:DNA-binding NarL/FixJ family response regulator
MFKKVIIADDLGSINEGVKAVLEKLGVKNLIQAQYCDEVYLKIKKSVLDNAPFELLITDLSFNADHRDRKYTSGEDLAEALRNDNLNLKIIVFSVEDRLQKVRTLFNKHFINAYVCKGRKGLIELEKAIYAVYNDEQYLSPHVSQALNHKLDLEITDFDIELIKQLSFGLSQEEISVCFKEKNISPSSLSSIEKHLNRLKIQFNANNATHLVAIVKDLGLI